MPRVRHQLVAAHLEASGRPIAPPEHAEHFARVARCLQVSSLTWVTEPMSMVALDASSTLPEWTVAAALPARFGLLVWEGGLPPLSWPGAPRDAWETNALGVRVPPLLPVDGVMWRPHGALVEVEALTRGERTRHALFGPWADVPLFPFVEIRVPLAELVDSPEPWTAGLLHTLGATWLLSQQPTVAATTSLPPDRDETRRAARAGRPPSPVTLVDLRRQAHPPREDAEPTGRHLHHRHLVTGHWRQQACGPGRSQRRPVFVPPYIRGPEGAPTVETEKVKVWRR